MLRVLSALAAGAVLALAVLLPGAAPVPAADYEFDVRDVRIPMRDGIRLHTVILTPKQARGPLPFLLTRSPYGVKGFAGAMQQGGPLVRDGYIFVAQDIRGRYESEGEFVMLRPPRDRSLPGAIDESTDAYDTIEWLLKHVPGHNGRAGMMGVSYGGWLTVMAMIDPHSALKAVSEQASPADMYIGDDFHHNGAFRLSYGFEYVARMETGRTNFNFDFDRYDTFEWYLRLGALSRVNASYFHNSRPTWNAFVAHPDYDAFWQKMAVPAYLDRPTVPNLNVAGWFDQEDFYGPVEIYRTLEKHDDRHLNYLVVGPWNHGGWRGKDGASLGPIEFGSNTSEYYRENIEAPWFAFWLKGRGSRDIPEARAFQTGSNRWEAYDAWPPAGGVTARNLYLRSGAALSFDPPPENSPEAFDSYVSDPAHPVPYRRRPIGPTYPGPGWPAWLVEDQRFVHLRPDVLSWETEPLDSDIVIAGDIRARFFASTSGTDSDWIVKLIDVYPEKHAQKPELGGYQLMIAAEVLRARYREGLERPKPLERDRVTGYTLDLHTNDHAFLKGHRIMVQIQSTWFPLIDRNPQKFVPNIFGATEPDFQKAVQRLFRSAQYPSRVELPVRTTPAN